MSVFAGFSLTDELVGAGTSAGVESANNCCISFANSEPALLGGRLSGNLSRGSNVTDIYSVKCVIVPSW